MVSFKVSLVRNGIMRKSTMFLGSPKVFLYPGSATLYVAAVGWTKNRKPKLFIRFRRRVRRDIIRESFVVWIVVSFLGCLLVELATALR